MTDVVSTSVRSQMMSGIRGKNSKPELQVRRLLFAAGFRFRLHRRDLPGTPDIVLPRRKVVIFVHGCFWHAHQGCRYAKLPLTRQEFWRTKLQSNVDRDHRDVQALLSMDWRVLLIWECAIRPAQAHQVLGGRILDWMMGQSKFGEIQDGTAVVSQPEGARLGDVSKL